MQSPYFYSHSYADGYNLPTLFGYYATIEDAETAALKDSSMMNHRTHGNAISIKIETTLTSIPSIVKTIQI